MKDLEGKELEVGTIYYILGSGSKVVISKFSHETKYSFVFKHVKRISTGSASVPLLPELFSWKRVIPKWKYSTNLPVIRVSQEVLNRYAIT